MSMDGEVFVYHQGSYSCYVEDEINVLFPTLYLDWACEQLGSPPGKIRKRRNENTKSFNNNYTDCNQSFYYRQDYAVLVSSI